MVDSTMLNVQRARMAHCEFLSTPTGARVNHTDDHNRADTGPLYWRAMKAAKIIVTANPGNWEGDFRLWEALCSKALVLVDRMYVELPHPFVDGEDVVVFDSLDRGSLMEKVRYYMEHEAEARRIAMNGFYKVRRRKGSVSCVLGLGVVVSVCVSLSLTHLTHQWCRLYVCVYGPNPGDPVPPLREPRGLHSQHRQPAHGPVLPGKDGTTKTFAALTFACV